MTDSTRYPETKSDADNNPSREGPPGMPRWVKVAAIIVGVLILLFVVLKITGIGGEHGPGRHMSGTGAPPFSLVAERAPSAVDHT